MLNPETGERFAERAVTGIEPEPCPPDTPELDTQVQIEGSEPTSEDFAQWLEGFVDGTAQ
jgi:hypothetical protein